MQLNNRNEFLQIMSNKQQQQQHPTQRVPKKRQQHQHQQQQIQQQQQQQRQINNTRKYRHTRIKREVSLRLHDNNININNYKLYISFFV